MKKMLLKFALALAFIGAIILGSCEIEPPIPDCQEYQYGDIKVVNNVGFSTRFDIHDDGSGKYVSNGSSYTWNDVDAGYYTMWIYIDSEWYYWEQDQRLVACETLTFTWYLDNKKSINNLYLEISRNGEVIKTITEFNAVTKYKK